MRTVLSAHNARIELDGAVAVPSLELATGGDRVVLVGSTEPIVAVIGSGRAPEDTPRAAPIRAAIVGGDVAVLERSVKSDAHRAVCGVALRDPPLPWRWTVQKLLMWAARLDGASRRQSKTLVASVLASLSLSALAGTRLRALSALERRVVVLASAIVSQPAAVLIEDPLHDLDEREAGLMLGAIASAVDGRASIVCLPKIRLSDASGELAKSATDIVLLRHGTLVLHERAIDLLAHARLYEVTVLDGADALKATLAQEGFELVGGPHHFSLILPRDRGPSTVLAAAARARAPVTSCLPLLG